jgi:hypothetical protein
MVEHNPQDQPKHYGSKYMGLSVPYEHTVHKPYSDLSKQEKWRYRLLSMAVNNHFKVGNLKLTIRVRNRDESTEATTPEEQDPHLFEPNR